MSTDVPGYSIVGGLRGRVIKTRQDPDTVAKLQEISWWNWKPEKVEENIGDFYLPVNEFTAKWLNHKNVAGKTI